MNFSDTISGTPPGGILQHRAPGYHRAELFATDVHPLNLQVRTGTSGFTTSWAPQSAGGAQRHLGVPLWLRLEPRIGKSGFLEH